MDNETKPPEDPDAPIVNNVEPEETAPTATGDKLPNPTMEQNTPDSDGSTSYSQSESSTEGDDNEKPNINDDTPIDYVGETPEPKDAPPLLVAPVVESPKKSKYPLSLEDPIKFRRTLKKDHKRKYYQSLKYDDLEKIRHKINENLITVLHSANHKYYNNNKDTRKIIINLRQKFNKHLDYIEKEAKRKTPIKKEVKNKSGKKSSFKK